MGDRVIAAMRGEIHGYDANAVGEVSAALARTIRPSFSTSSDPHQNMKEVA